MREDLLMTIAIRAEDVRVGDRLCIGGIWRTCDRRSISDSCAEVTLTFGAIRRHYHHGLPLDVERDPSSPAGRFAGRAALTTSQAYAPDVMLRKRRSTPAT